MTHKKISGIEIDVADYLRRLTHDELVAKVLELGLKLQLLEAQTDSSQPVKAEIKAEDTSDVIICGRVIKPKAKLQGANLYNAELQNAELQGAHLHNANLQGANLPYAQLQGAYLRNAKLQDAKLQYANLQYADLQDAEFNSDTDFEGCLNIQSADFTGSTDFPTRFKRLLSEEQVASIKSWS